MPFFLFVLGTAGVTVMLFNAGVRTEDAAPFLIMVILIACLFLVAVHAARLLGSEGEAPSSLGEGPSAPVTDTLAAMKPEDVFGLWANGRLIGDEDGQVGATEAYTDYVDTCRINGVQPVSSVKFGALIKARADNSEGRILRKKSSGTMVYAGWRGAWQGGNFPSRDASLPDNTGSLPGTSLSGNSGAV